MKNFITNHFLMIITIVLMFATANEGYAAEHSVQPAKHKSYVRSAHNYKVPDVTMTTAHGEQVNVATLLAAEESAIISFVFTSCAGVCPMISATMASATKGLDTVDPDYGIYLVSLDPEYDTPERLTSYAKRFNTGSKVHFLTGDVEDVRAFLQSVDSVYEGGNKMNHQPITLMRIDDSAEWLRFDGMISGKSIAEEYQRAKSINHPASIAIR